MTGMGKLWPDPLRAAAAIRERVRTELGFTVNVGIAHNKLLAKMASDMEKPDKTHTLFEDEIPRKLWPMPVGKLFLVGGHSADRLRRAGIYTIGDLAACDMASLSSLIGVKTAQLYHDFANGIDPSKVLDHPEEAKGYSASTTTEEDLADREKLHAILRELADTAASRMRRDGFRTQCVGVKIRSGSFSNRTNRSHQRKLSQASNITAEITGAAVSLFDELWDGRTPLRLIGISLTDVTKEQAVQLSLFGDDTAVLHIAHRRHRLPQPPLNRSRHAGCRTSAPAARGSRQLRSRRFSPARTAPRRARRKAAPCPR